jgi:predicted nucleotidyltransferase
MSNMQEAEGNRPTINRQVAAELLGSMLRRVNEVNADESFAFFVEEVRLFGSYLRGDREIGDLDVAVSFMRKTHAKCQSRFSEISKRSPEKQTERDLYEAAMVEIEDYLRCSCPWLDISFVGTIRNQRFSNKLIYRLPAKRRIVKAIRSDEDSEDVGHLHAISAMQRRR